MYIQIGIYSYRYLPLLDDEYSQLDIYIWKRLIIDVLLPPIGFDQLKEEYAAINIKVTREIKDRLDHKKVHPREPYYEVIERLLDCTDKETLLEKKETNLR